MWKNNCPSYLYHLQWLTKFKYSADSFKNTKIDLQFILIFFPPFLALMLSWNLKPETWAMFPKSKTLLNLKLLWESEELDSDFTKPEDDKACELTQA